MLIVEGYEFVVVWHGALLRPGGTTKGELLPPIAQRPALEQMRYAPTWGVQGLGDLARQAKGPRGQFHNVLPPRTHAVVGQMTLFGSAA